MMKRSIWKRIVALLAGIVTAASLVACGSQGDEGATAGGNPSESRQEESQTEGASAKDQSQPSAEAGKTLVVYYSATGHTENVAGYIAAATNADIFVLEPVEPYSSDDLDWTDESSRVSREHENEEERNVELVAATVEDWESYDTVFIGYAGGIIGLNQEKPINQGFALV